MATLDPFPAQYYDIPYYRNDEFTRSIIVTDEDDDPVDLSAKDLLMQIKNYKGDSTALYELTSGSEITVGGVNSNVVTFSGTYDLEPGSYYYDLRNTTDSETIMYGQFIVTGDVARA